MSLSNDEPQNQKYIKNLQLNLEKCEKKIISLEDELKEKGDSFNFSNSMNMFEGTQDDALKD